MASPGRPLLLVFAACADPPGGAGLEIAARCAPIESLSLPTTQIDQTANAFIQITNRGTSAERGLELRLDGPDAAEFSVSNACDRELDPGAFCLMEVSLTPRSTGDK